MGGKIRIAPDENVEITLFTRPTGNQLRNSIERSMEDGQLSNVEKVEIGALYTALGGLVTRNDEGSIAAEVSPIFTLDNTITSRGTGGIYADYNQHSAHPLGYPNVVRPGFELNALDAIAESVTPTVISTGEVTGIGSSPLTPPTLQGLFDAIENGQIPAAIDSHKPDSGNSNAGSDPFSPNPTIDVSDPDNFNDPGHQSGSSEFDPWYTSHLNSEDTNETLGSNDNTSHSNGGINPETGHDTSYDGSTGYGGEFGGIGVDDGGAYGGHDRNIDAADPRSMNPVVLDLDGDGVEITFGQQMFFDWDDDGFLEQGSWASADDGFLVLDLNADGTRGDGDDKIDQARELVFSLWGEAGDTDLQALQRAFDENNDYVLDASDSVWSELRVWQDLDQDGSTFDDLNRNGVLDAGEEDQLADGSLELRSLDELGISQINLAYDDTDILSRVAAGEALAFIQADATAMYGDTSDDISVFGNTLHGVASFTHDGSVLTTPESAVATDGVYTAAAGVGDVTLTYNTQGWRQVWGDFGYTVEFESGDTYRIGDVSGKASADLDLTAFNLDGALGDHRNNTLNATGHIASVQISGGEGDDVITGGWAADFLAGEAGADNIDGGEGDDVIFFDADDTIMGRGGWDSAISTEYDIFDDAGTQIYAAKTIVLNLQSRSIESYSGGDGIDEVEVTAEYVTAISVSLGKGNDIATGGKGDDVLSGDGGDDLLTGNRGNDVLSGGADQDTLNGGNGDDLLLGDLGDDSILGENGDDRAYGGDGSDTIDGGQGDDTLYGSVGDDSLLGGVDGDDLLDGGDGNDTLVGDIGDDTLLGGNGNDSITAGHGDDSIRGGAGNDTIHIGRFGDNWVEGGDGDDHFHASNYAGRNLILGGVGDDRLHLEGVGSEYRIYQNLDVQAAGIPQWRIEGTGGLNLFLTIMDIERVVFSDGQVLQLTGLDPAADNSERFWLYDDIDHLSSFGRAYGDLDSLAAHTYVGDGTAWVGHLHTGDDAVWGSDGTANINLGTGDDAAATGLGEDSVLGNSGNDAIWGEGGNDTLNGQTGSDSMHGGTENDQLEGGSGSDLLSGGDQEDSLIGGSGSDVLLGGNGFDSIRGGDGGDIIRGGAQADSLWGEDGNDLLEGEHGQDRLFGGDGADELSGGDHNDTLLGGVGNDMLRGGNHEDQLLGEGGNDRLFGDNGLDTLDGGTGHDWLYGGAQADSLDGGSGDDYLFGGDGADRLHGGNGTDYLEGGAGGDVINGGNFPTDIASYTSSDAAVSVDLAAGTAEGGHATDDTLMNIEALQGSRFGDTLSGSAVANTLNGDAGKDRLEGYAGNDRLIGGLGADTAFGGDGNDVIIGDGYNAALLGTGFVYEYRVANEGLGIIGNFSELANGTTVGHGFMSNFDVEAIDTLHSGNGDQFGLIMVGTLEIAIAGDYTFNLDFNSGLKIIIDGVEHYANYGVTGAVSTTITLSEGAKNLELQYFERDGPDQGFEVSVTGPDTASELVDLFSSGLLAAPTEDMLSPLYDDELHGGNGDDFLVGGDGHDALNGDQGADEFNGGDGNDSMSGGMGDDTFFTGEGADTVDGGDGTDLVHFLGAETGVVADLKFAEQNDGLALGDVYVDVENLQGGNTNDNLSGTDGANALWGESGDDALIGRAGNDSLTGGNGNDSLNGDGGFDILAGGLGDDVLIGGGNWDIFAFESNSGNDTITDFDVANAFEHIDLSAVAGVTQFTDLTMTSEGGNAIIDLGGGNTITLLGVSAGDLTASEFVF